MRVVWLKEVVVYFGLEILDAVVLVFPVQLAGPRIGMDDGEYSCLLLWSDEIGIVLQPWNG